MKRRYLLLILISIPLFSCEKNVLEPNTDLLGYQFYPIAVGDEYTYAVEEINYRNTGSIDTLRYQIIDRILAIEEQTEAKLFTGYRYLKDLNGDESILSTLSITIDDYSVLRKLGNTKEIQFSFPVKEAASWDAIPDIAIEDQYQFYKAFQPYELLDTVFNQTVQVIEEDNQDSLTFLDTRINVYAADVGQVYKLSSQIEFCTLPECFGLKEIEIGKTIRMKRIIE